MYIDSRANPYAINGLITTTFRPTFNDTSSVIYDAGPIIDQNQYFNVVFPCLSASVIANGFLPTMQYPLNGTLLNVTMPIFNDSIALSHNKPFFCGQISYTLLMSTGEACSFAYINGTRIFVQSGDFNLMGPQFISLVATLVDYHTINVSIPF